MSNSLWCVEQLAKRLQLANRNIQTSITGHGSLARKISEIRVQRKFTPDSFIAQSRMPKNITFLLITSRGDALKS